MQKIILKITFIILGNLLAFVVIGLILDAIFDGQGKFLLISVIISLPVFGLIMYLKIGNILEELQKLTKK
ncbi:hypothetical protein N9J72_01370 [Candidatus Gracilibacteria bacterium]|nr:hypothetical protein [Candidatus Gracilibacteria bacterium]